MERTSGSPIQRHRKKKTLNACRRCRLRKIKCSGLQPCQSCHSKNLRCMIDEREKRIVTSENYVLALQNRILALESASPNAVPGSNRSEIDYPQRQATASFEQPFIWHDGEHILPVTNTPHDPGEIEPRAASTSSHHQRTRSQSIMHLGDGHADEYRDRSADLPLVNPLTASKSQLLFHDYGNFRYLGHSSTWSFSRQMRNLLNTPRVHSPVNDMITKGDGVLYEISWQSNTVDLSRIELPSKEQAEYLANTVCFYLGSLYHLFDKFTFLKRLHEFYNQREESVTQQTTGLFHVQMLLVLACGKSLLAREVSPAGPAGIGFFLPAMEGLPDIRMLQREPILAVETLSLLALFLEAADIISGAHGYIGQAVRIALQQGMNREFDSGILTPSEIDHRSKLWWTVYIIDRRLTALMGVPLMLQDADITLPAPIVPMNGKPQISFAFHVRLSNQLGRVLSVVYGLQGRLGGSFIEGIQSILKSLSEISADLNNGFKGNSPRPSNKIGRTAASLYLLYHQCSILAIRPVLFPLLETKLTKARIPNLSDAVIALLKVCVESAVQVMKIVESLKADTLLDLFLPYDLDVLFSAASAFVLIDIITPAMEGQGNIKIAFSLLDHMIGRGIAPAALYREHLEELDDFRQTLRHREVATPRRHSPGQLQYQDGIENEPNLLRNMRSDTLEPSGFNSYLEQESIWSYMSMDDNIDLTVLCPDTMRSAMIGLNPSSLAASADYDADNQWLWGNYTADVDINSLPL